jgi:hypothetical protein
MSQPIVFYDLKRFAGTPESEWGFSPNTWRTRLAYITTRRVAQELTCLLEQPRSQH